MTVVSLAVRRKPKPNRVAYRPVSSRKRGPGIDAFSFVFSLFSIVLGLALTEVLGGLGKALQSRKKVKIGWLTPLLGLLIGLDVTSFWSVGWSVRSRISAHYLALMSGLFITGVYYLAARLAFPADPSEWPDFDRYYFEHKRMVIGGVIICNLMANMAQLALGFRLFGDALTIAETLGTYLFFSLIFVARTRRQNVLLLIVTSCMYPLFAVFSMQAGGY